ncbi:MAG: DNA polymerase I, partial [Planctomycetaceae bacterium]
GYYIAVRGPADARLMDPGLVCEALRPVLEAPDLRLANQNIKYDLLVLRRAGIRVTGIGMDPMVGSYLLEAGARSHGLDELARRYLGHEMIPISNLIGKGKQQKRMDEVPVPLVAEYAVEDAEVAWSLSRQIAAQLKEEGLWELYWTLERPLIEVLVDMQERGIRVEVDQLRTQSAHVGQRLDTLRREIFEAAGREFNIDSPKQLSQVLFQELSLPVVKKTQTGSSTDQEVLEQLAPLHPLPRLLLEHRTLTKLKGTYLDALPELVNPETGRIHCSFNQVVAATGRLSSSEPNLQNIPVRTPEGQLVRRAFVPSQPGWLLLCADYSQIELRMLAHFSQDSALSAAFRDGLDVHTAVASEVFGVPPEQVDSTQRRMAKAVNFGVIYGQSPFGLATGLQIPKETAAKFIDDYFKKYAGVDRYLEQLLRDCAASGYATTILGRRRAIQGIRELPGKARQRNLPERTAINTVIQGSAADLIKQAMLKVNARLKEVASSARLLLQIHDELVFEAPADTVAELSRLVREEMSGAMPLRVPLLVDVTVGPNWLDQEEVAEVVTGSPFK